MEGQGKKYIDKKPDGSGGAFYAYNVNGRLHWVHVRGNPNAQFGERDEHKVYDHSNPVLAHNGMNMAEVGYMIGSAGKKIKEGEPQAAHIHEKALQGYRDSYQALKAHSEQFGGSAPRNQVSLADHQKVSLPVMERFHNILSNVRNNNPNLNVRDRSEVNHYLFQSITKALTKVARTVTKNPELRFDFDKGVVVHGAAGHNISQEDFQKLHQSGFYNDAANQLSQIEEQVKNPLTPEFVESIKQEWRGLGTNIHPQDAKQADWYHPDIDTAKQNFMKPLEEMLGAITERSKQKLQAQGAGPSQAERQAAEYTDKIRKAVESHFGSVVPGASFSMPEHKVVHKNILNLPHESNHHETLLGLQSARNNVIQKLHGLLGQI